MSKEQISYGTAKCGHVGQIFKTGLCAHCYIDRLKAQNAKLVAALSALVNAEEGYGDPSNVAINQAWEPARALLREIEGA